MKQILCTLVAVVIASSLFAQDRLYKKDGSILEVKIKEVGPKTIVYKKWNNPDGPDFVINKNDVEKLKFQNGDEEHFGERRTLRPVRMRERERGSYGGNIISLSPVHFTNTSITGFGLQYERVLDPKGFISLYLPAVYSFRNYDYYDDYNISQEESSHMYWFYPGVKFYPTDCNHKVTYSVGASLAIGTGNIYLNKPVYDSLLGYRVNKRVHDDFFQMGIMINNSINFQPSQKVYLGLELGLGIPYADNQPNDTYYGNGIDFNEVPLVHFAFKIGYRF